MKTAYRKQASAACPRRQSGHATAEFQCPLLGVKRTLPGSAAMSASDPKRTSSVRDCCRANGPLNRASQSCPADSCRIIVAHRLWAELLEPPADSSDINEPAISNSHIAAADHT